MGDGRFFDKRAKVEDGRFFRDMPGRDAADFHKAANPDPTFLWDQPISDGFHRPAKDQPEALEAGGTRFQSSDADYGTGVGFQHGVVEGGSLKYPVAAGSQMGKHASKLPRFLGTAYEKRAYDTKNIPDDLNAAKDKAVALGKEYGSKALDVGGKTLDKIKQYGSQALETLKGSTEGLGDKADEAINAASRHPVGAGLMIGGAGLLGAKAARGAGRGLARLVRGKPKPPPGLISRALAALGHK